MRNFFLALLVIANVLVIGKLWLDASHRPVASPVQTQGAAMPIQAPHAETKKTVVTESAEAVVEEDALPLETQEEPTSSSSAPDDSASKLEKAQIAWTETWNRPIPDANSIEIDMSQRKKKGDKGTVIPYVEPAPLTSGMRLNNADGTLSTVYGDTIVNADGSKATIDGHQILKADGTLGEMVGDEIWWSDGSKSTR